MIRDLTFQSSPSQGISVRFPAIVIGNDRKAAFGVSFMVKNIGRARSHNSHARIFVGDAQIDSQLVGPIDPGKGRRVQETYHKSFAGPGFFDMHVCVGDNCSRHLRFAGVPRRWDVNKFSTGPNTLTGFAPFFASAASGLSFRFYGTISDNGTPYYLWLANGGVTGDITGSEGICTYSGHGAVSHAQWDVVPPQVGYLEISPQLDAYFAEIHDDDHSFIGTTTCTGYPTLTSDFDIDRLETIGLDGRVDRSMESDARTLEGHYNIPTDIGTGYTVGEWSFRADLP